MHQAVTSTHAEQSLVYLEDLSARGWHRGIISEHPHRRDEKSLPLKKLPSKKTGWFLVASLRGDKLAPLHDEPFKNADIRTKIWLDLCKNQENTKGLHWNTIKKEIDLKHDIFFCWILIDDTKPQQIDDWTRGQKTSMEQPVKRTSAAELPELTVNKEPPVQERAVIAPILAILAARVNAERDTSEPAEPRVQAFDSPTSRTLVQPFIYIKAFVDTKVDYIASWNVRGTPTTWLKPDDIKGNKTKQVLARLIDEKPAVIALQEVNDLYNGERATTNRNLLDEIATFLGGYRLVRPTINSESVGPFTRSGIEKCDHGFLVRKDIKVLEHGFLFDKGDKNLFRGAANRSGIDRNRTSAAADDETPERGCLPMYVLIENEKLKDSKMHRMLIVSIHAPPGKKNRKRDVFFNCFTKPDAFPNAVRMLCNLKPNEYAGLPIVLIGDFNENLHKCDDWSTTHGKLWHRTGSMFTKTSQSGEGYDFALYNKEAGECANFHQIVWNRADYDGPQASDHDPIVVSFTTKVWL